MSRAVKNLRFMGTIGKISDADKGGPKGTSAAYGGVTKQDGRANLGAGKYEGKSSPAFDRAGKVLTKYTGPSI